jgi:HlyD family secretion protein
VHVGEVLATLDPTSFQAAVDSAKASLRLANANLSNAKNNVQKSNAQKELIELTLKRDEGLAKQNLIAQSQIDADRTAALTANLDYLSSQGTVSVAETQVSVAQAQVQQAEYNLSRTIVTSPIDGVVLSRSVSVGQSVAASLQAPILFILVTSLSEMQVDTAVDQADVGSVQKGQAAEITVTAYPNARFQGTVKEVRVEPTTVQNVVTYDAVVNVHDTTGRLFPGMAAQVVIQTGSRTHVPTVPIAALLYRPVSARTGGSDSNGPGGFAAFGGGVRVAGGGRGGAPTATTAPVAGAPGSRVVVWVLREGRPQPIQTTIGMSDERNIEITSNELKIGDEVVVAERSGAAARRSSGTASAAGGRPAVAAGEQTQAPASGQRGRTGN